MTTLHASKDPLPRGVSPTPSKIPVRCQRRPPFPTVKARAPDQENQDPRGAMQKPLLTLQRPLQRDSPGPRLKAKQQTKKAQCSEGITPARTTLEELRPDTGRQNVGPGLPPHTEAPAAVEFVADPVALATILSGEGVKNDFLGCHSGLARRVLIQGSKGSTSQRAQGARASAYLAPRTPIHPLDPARASCFSRLEGPGPRGRIVYPQRLEAVAQLAGPSLPFSATRPNFQELRQLAGGNSRSTASQASELLLETPAQPGEHEVAPHSDEGGGAPLGLAQRVPLREIPEMPHSKDRQGSHLMPSPATQPMPGRVVPPSIRHPSPFGRAQRVPSPGVPAAATSYSVLRRFTMRPKTRFTPISSNPRVQQARWLRGLSPQSCREDPALPWGQIAVRLFDQETHGEVQESPGESSVAPLGLHPNAASSLQELKLQRISILQQLLRQEVEGLAWDKCASLNGAPSLDMAELQSLLAEMSRTVKAAEPDSGTACLHRLSQPAGLLESCLLDKGGEAQPCLTAMAPAPPESCSNEIPESSPQEQHGVPEPCPAAEPEDQQPSFQGQARHLEPCLGVEQRASKVCFLQHSSPGSSTQPYCNLGTPGTTSLSFSSQQPLCANPPIYSLHSPRSPIGQAGPSSLAPRALALRQRLKACLSAIHGFHEARLDDECAFYTSRAPPSGTSRVCTNPVATLLEWQDALSFVPVGSAAPQDSPP
ncbi:tastin isoform X2 [Ochotona princeps]|uniref:tastin isoform X2 n=1 Tax=Ochotona princeps TaxID=9978 RepID=UPI00271535E8|nr:tastin isoform X2 [Ochotona princeps]